ncbi:hypothetical protein SAMN04490357_1029 [Streptomyces misionensis]|uniref:Uncharacterized protein n=1 Tax=Streptomyces misionensis TaxID=67331 RepID=A0A1H4P9G9_9ACTN|nr:hypothetical protein [Streptomyces misionensis]SEC04060.1 hypothetical protein SAMN04490357_1029 [Streptomyces misionensis]
MQVIKVADDGTLRIEFTADEAKQIRDDLDGAWCRAGEAGKEFVRYVDTLYGERPAPTFPGGGF